MAILQPITPALATTLDDDSSYAPLGFVLYWLQSSTIFARNISVLGTLCFSDQVGGCYAQPLGCSSGIQLVVWRTVKTKFPIRFCIWIFTGLAGSESQGAFDWTFGSAWVLDLAKRATCLCRDSSFINLWFLVGVKAIDTGHVA